MAVFDCATGEVRAETEAEIMARAPTLEQVKTDAIDALRARCDALTAVSAVPVGVDFVTYIAQCHADYLAAKAAVEAAESREAVAAVLEAEFNQ